MPSLELPFSTQLKWNNMNSLTLSAAQIVSSDYTKLFGSNSQAAKTIYRKLLKKWHPDMNADDTSHVFVYITEVFSKGESGITKKSISIDGYTFSYIFSNSSGLYDIYYLEGNKVNIVFKMGADKLIKNYARNYHDVILKNLKGHRLASRYKGLLAANIFSKDSVVQIALPTDFVPLSLLIEYIDDFKEYRVSAYIISRMFDLAMMHNHLGLSYVGFDPAMIFVNTVDHTIVDLSAMFYSTEIGTNMIALPPFLIPSITHKDMASKQCSSNSTMNMLQRIAHRLAGDTTYTGSPAMTTSDEKDFVRIIAGFSDLEKSYEKWLEADVKTLFKERSFYKKVVTMKDLLKYT